MEKIIKCVPGSSFGNEYKLKGKRFDVEAVTTKLFNHGKIETSSMVYGKKTDNTAHKEYQKCVDPSYQIIKMGLIICLQQSWLSCNFYIQRQYLAKAAH